MELLNKIQQALKVPKSHHNSFGNYDYRNAEDILEAVKPLLGKGILVVSDEIVNVGTRYYVKATAQLRDEKTAIEVTAYARESEDKKGMDSAQITGAASSYARKYALNGLFLIDDAKDADGDDNTATAPIASKKAPTAFAKPPVYKSDAIKEQEAKKRIATLCDKLNGDIETKPVFSSKEDGAKHYGDIVQKLTGRSLELAPVEELELIGDELGKLFDSQE